MSPPPATASPCGAAAPLSAAFVNEHTRRNRSRQEPEPAGEPEERALSALPAGGHTTAVSTEAGGGRPRSLASGAPGATADTARSSAADPQRISEAALKVKFHPPRDSKSTCAARAVFVRSGRPDFGGPGGASKPPTNQRGWFVRSGCT